MVSQRALHTAREETEPRLGAAISVVFDKLRGWSMARVGEVNDMTSRESLAAGDSLNSIVNLSRSYVEYMREAMGRFSAKQERGAAADDAHGPGDHTSGIEAIEEQNQMLATYLGRLESALASQDRVAQEALKQLTAVRRAGTHILEVSNQARMLAVNARIEAARLTGTEGGAFGVIASEMSTFAKNMQAQSDEIVQIVDGLTSSLPKIADMAEELRVSTETFSANFSRKNSDVSLVVDELQTTIADALRHGDEQVAQVLRHSQDALSHLQFQDPCAQRLLQIEADILEAQRCAKQVLDTGDTEHVDSLSSADSHRAAAAGHVMIFDDDSAGAGERREDAPLAAGELLLF